MTCKCNQHDGLGGINHTCQQKKPHIHAELIKAWADGATIQHKAMLIGGSIWLDDKTPRFYNDIEYRIKPEIKPDFYAYAQMQCISHANEDCFRAAFLSSKSSKKVDNVKFIFDGETRKLKSVELLSR
jgi:hypothetical protein